MPRTVRRYASDATCAVDGCDTRPRARGMCERHWRRWRTHGDPLAGRPPATVTRVLDHPDGTRTCTACQQRIPLVDFDLDANASGGRRSHCKPCRSARMKAWYAANRERQAARQKARCDANREAVRARQREYRKDPRVRQAAIDAATESIHRRRALMAGVTRDRGITVTALRKRHGDACCYCGRTMSFAPTKAGGFTPDKATLEHRVPLSRGGTHTWDNTALACWQCNLHKNRRTPHEWAEHLASLTPRG